MKKNRLFFMFAALFVAAAVMFSCQKEEMVNEDLSLKVAGVGEYEFLYDEPICVDVEHEFCLGFWAPSNKQGVVQKIKYEIHLSLDGENWLELAKGEESVTAGAREVCVDYTFSEAGSYEIMYKLQGKGYEDEETEEPTIVFVDIEVTDCDCSVDDEDFTYVVNGTQVTFTYTPWESFTGFVEFTFPQATVITAPEGFTQPGSGNVRQKNETFVACEPVSWTFDLAGNCTGEGQNTVNAFTDFKVDGTSKKFGVGNVTFSCPE